MGRRKTKVTHTHSTHEFLVLSAKVDKLQSVLSTLYFWEQDLANWVKSWDVPRTRLGAHLHASWIDTKASPILKKVQFPLTLRGDGSWALTDAPFVFPARQSLNGDISVCLGIYRMERL